MTPIARKLLAPSLDTFGRSSTLPAEAYTAWSVFRWEQEHFFDRSWVCAGRAGDPREETGDRRGAEWQGWHFANASGDAPTFEEHAGNLEELVRSYGCEELVVAARRDYQIAANWKILAENYHECYHCSSIHPELCKVSPPKSGEDHEAQGAWIGGSMELEDHAETMSLDGKSHAPKLPRLTEGQDHTVYYFQLFPNLLISLHPDYVMTHRLRPLAPDRTAVECEWLFSKEAVEQEGFDPSYASDFWDITNGQDWGACEGVQRGVSSRGYRQGPLSPDESTSGKFVATVARGYLEGGIYHVPDQPAVS